MYKYRVIACRTDESRMLLEGGAGLYHWARALNSLPPVGKSLIGGRPHLGFGLLLCSRPAATFRVMFESVNSDDRDLDPRFIP